MKIGGNRGATGKYKIKETPRLAEKLAEKYGYDSDIWNGLEITSTTFYNYYNGKIPRTAFKNLITDEEIKNRRNEFKEAIMRGKAIWKKKIVSLAEKRILKTIADKNNENIKLATETAKWYLTKVNFKEFGEREKISIGGIKNEPIETKNISGPTFEEILKDVDPEARAVIKKAIGQSLEKQIEESENKGNK